jgi:hypothetical protein
MYFLQRITDIQIHSFIHSLTLAQVKEVGGRST